MYKIAQIGNPGNLINYGTSGAGSRPWFSMSLDLLLYKSNDEKKINFENAKDNYTIGRNKYPTANLRLS